MDESKTIEERLRMCLEDLVETIEAHDAIAHTCDRDGNEYCDCLEKAVKRAKNLLNKEENK